MFMLYYMLLKLDGFFKNIGKLKVKLQCLINCKKKSFLLENTIIVIKYKICYKIV